MITNQGRRAAGRFAPCVSYHRSGWERERMESGERRARANGQRERAPPRNALGVLWRRSDTESEGRKACALCVIPSSRTRTRANEKRRKKGRSEQEARASAAVSGALRHRCLVFR